jgi:hypothetical protein
MLSISEEQRLRFPRALKHLDIKPHYRLSDLEPLVVQPIQDKMLADICSCFYCTGGGIDREPTVEPYRLEEALESKSKGIVSI